MEIPSYWLPRPIFDLEPEVVVQLEAIHSRWIAAGSGNWVDEPLPVPKWVFLCWLTDQKGLLLHGSNHPDIEEFEPRAPDAKDDDEFSQQTAVFAASDGIWPMWYAILDRSNYRLRMLNSALRFDLPSGELSDPRYYFSITDTVLARQPWRDGVIYVLPPEQFMVQPPYRVGQFMVHDPHWARLSSVKPLAKLGGYARGFPFAGQGSCPR